jgi:transposase
MRQNSGPQSAEKHVKEIRRRTRRKFSAEEKIRIVLAGLRGEASIAELCRREGHRRRPVLQLVEGVPGSWQAPPCGRHGARGLIWRGDQDLRHEMGALKEAVADLTLENRLLKKSMIADGDDPE